MREQPQREFRKAAKRQWVTPSIRQMALTEDLIRLFKSAGRTADALVVSGDADRESQR